MWGLMNITYTTLAQQWPEENDEDSINVGTLGNFCSHQPCCLNEGLTVLFLKILYFPLLQY